jgi:hypothetical protein
MTNVHVHIYSITHGTLAAIFIKPLTNIFDSSELANKQANELRIKKYIHT